MNTFGPPQRVLVRGEGCYVWDADGSATSTCSPASRSTRSATPTRSCTQPSRRSWRPSATSPTSSPPPPQIALAERLLRLLGHHDDGRVFFTNSGTEANEAALKATRRTGRTKIVSTEGAFHGRSMGALALTWKPAYRAPFEPLPGDVEFVPYGDAAALAAAVDDQTAAVVLEPIQGESGVVVPPAAYLAAAREITSEHGALLWLDEVQTGIGRTGAWFAHTSTGVVPDLVTLAKGLGSGFPIGACVGIGAARRLLGPGDHGTTFGGNPVAAMAGLATLGVIERDGLLANARRGRRPSRRRGRRRSATRSSTTSADAACCGRSRCASAIAPQVAAAALDAGLHRQRADPDVTSARAAADHQHRAVDTFVAALPRLLDTGMRGGTRRDPTLPSRRRPDHRRSRPRSSTWPTAFQADRSRRAAARPAAVGRGDLRQAVDCAPGSRSRSASPSSAATRW